VKTAREGADLAEGGVVDHETVTIRQDNPQLGSP
jgi:hypothetical protein